MNMSIVVGILLTLAVGAAIAAALGMALMRDTFQRLHFSACVVSLSVGLVALAVWLEDRDPQARIKVLFVAALLFATNSILTHATARAARVHLLGHWELQPEEDIAIVSAPNSERPADRKAPLA